MAYNQSRIKSFRRCQKQYSFRYDTVPGKELVPKVSSLPLKRGSWLHELQEEYHREWAGVDGASWTHKHIRLRHEFEDLFDEEKALLGDLPGECLRLFRSYLRFSRRQHDEERYSVATLADGARPAIEFVVEQSLRKYGIKDPFKGRLDLLVEDREYGGLWIWDAKWVRGLPSPDERMMSPQSLLYVWAAREMDLDVRGFVYNYGRTKPPTIPRTLVRGTLSMASKMDTDYWTYLAAIKELHGDDWELWAKKVYKPKLLELKNREGMWFRRERVPVDKDRINRALREFLATVSDIEHRTVGPDIPRSYFYNCKFTCEYHDLCVSEFTGLDIGPLIERRFTTQEERYADEVDDQLSE